MCSLSHVQLFATAWTVAPKAPLPMGLSQREYWSGLPFPSPGDLPNSSTEPVSPVSPEMAGRFFITEPPWKPFIKGIPRSKKKKKNPEKKNFFSVIICTESNAVYGQTFPSCSQWGLHFAARHRFLTAVVFLVVEHRPQGAQASVVAARGLSCPAACGTFPVQRVNPRPLHWQGDS